MFSSSRPSSNGATAGNPPMNLDEYDFIDFGASSGGSLKWATKVFDARRGIGIDIDPAKIEKLRATGAAGIVHDASTFSLEGHRFRFATFMHFLEHLPDKATAHGILLNAYRAVDEFMFIRGPDFGSRRYLRERGFKKYFADWSGHTWHHGVKEFEEVAGLFPQARSVIFRTGRVRDSSHRAIIPFDWHRNRGPYNPEKDPMKDYVEFGERKIYDTITLIIGKSPACDLAKLALQSSGLDFTEIAPRN
jgi:hypothetical protein